MVTKAGNQPPVKAVLQGPRSPGTERQGSPRGDRRPVAHSDQRPPPTLWTIHGNRRALSRRVTQALHQSGPIRTA